MRMLQLIGAVLILFASPAIAKDAVAAWTVAQKSGDVRVVRNGMQPTSVNLRAALAPGDIVATGANGRAMLTKGDDYVVVAPGSRLVVPQAQERSGYTRLIQQLGTMLYKVKRTGVPHFAVDTPMLAAVVKGTTFTIVVDQKGAAVQVTEGVVEVSSLTGDARRLVHGGLTVYVGRERPNEIIEVKPNAVQLPGVARVGDEVVQIEGSGAVSLTTISTLTDGLVREAPIVKLVSAMGNVVTLPSGSSTAAAPALLAPVSAALAETTVVTTATGPVLGAVATTLPVIAEPAVSLVQATLPIVTQPVVQIVQATVPAITQPVVEIVQATVPAITQPAVQIVQATVPAITQPVISIVPATVPVVTQPVVEIVQAIVPAVTQPVISIVPATVPVVTQPVVPIVQTTVPVVTQPVVNVVAAVPIILCTLLCR